MLWSKQFYHYDVERWLDGDPSMPQPPRERLNGRNKDWRHLDSLDVLSMPDTWEYPWFASWDLAFHCVALAHVDADFAKRQLLLLLREWYQHPNGELPAYEWAFGDANPPVHAWAAFQVFRIDGQRDFGFLKRVFHKLLINFTWWVNKQDEAGNNVFEGGFLGLDNVGPIDRSAALPPGQILEQSDGSAWMARYCLDLLEIAVTLAMHDRAYEDVATKFFEHFTYIATAMNDQGLWDEKDGFYYDVLRAPDGTSLPLKCRSMVGLIPITAAMVLEDEVHSRLPDFAFRMSWFERNKPEYAEVVAHTQVAGTQSRRLLSIVGPTRLRRILEAMLDEHEFLSPHGIRSLSRFHLEHPLEVTIGGVEARVDYEPAESQSGSFGGNSNWRGPVWMPGELHARRLRAPLSALPRRRLHDRAAHRFGEPPHPRRGRRRADRSARLAVLARRGAVAVRASATSRRCRPTPRGATTCSSMSTSTETTARASARHIKRDGLASSST